MINKNNKSENAKRLDYAYQFFLNEGILIFLLPSYVNTRTFLHEPKVVKMAFS